ncbi:MAG: hypothetical protein LUG91_03965 [Ruminococcus sp.]|nr:hypothetical protein [Ruminococcus sp.]
MKKILKFMALMISALLITSCENKEKESNNNINLLVDTQEPFYINYERTSYENGRIYGSDPARYIDFDSMESTVLCAKPNCTHKDSECVGKIIGERAFMYNDYLYYFEYTNELEEESNGERKLILDSKLCRVSIDSSEIEIVAEFNDCIPHDWVGYVIYNDKLFFTATDMNPVEDEYGQIIVSNVGGIHYICSIDFDTGEYKNYGSIYDGDRQYEEAHNSSSVGITGVYNSKIYIQYSFLKEPIPTDDSSNSSDVHFTILNFEFDLSNYELEESSLPPSYFMDSDSYIYYDSENNKSILIDKGITYEFDCNVGTTASFMNNKLFVPNEQKWYDLSDMSEYSMGEYSDYIVTTYYDGCYILINGYKTVKLTEEELLAL